MAKATKSNMELSLKLQSPLFT